MRGVMATSVALMACLACGAADAQPQPPSALALTNRAQDLYLEGRARFLAGNFAEAQAAFESSLDAFDSPNTRLYLGRTYARLGRLPEAWATLDRTARDAAARAQQEPRYAPTAAAARAEADALAPQIGRLSVEVSPAPDALALTINGHPIARAALGVAIPVDPGDVVVMARAPGFAPALQMVSVDAGAQAAVRLTLLPSTADAPSDAPADAPMDAPGNALPAAARPLSLPAPSPSTNDHARRIGAWRGAGTVALVLGAASLVGAGALYYLTAQTYEDLAARTQPSPTDNARVDRGIALQYSAFGLGGLSAALLITGSIMRWGLGRQHAEAPAARPALTVEPTARGLVVSGAF